MQLENSTVHVFNKVIRLFEQDAGPSKSIVRLNNSLIDSTRTKKYRFFRREAVIIQHGNKQVLRFVMGNPGTIKGLTRDAIAIDYDGFDMLELTYPTSENVSIQVRKASLLEVYRWYWNNPDMYARVSTRVAISGWAIGLLGLLSALISAI